MTLFDKVWSTHEVVAETAGTPAVLFIDLHLVHEVSSPQGFEILRKRDLSVRSPSRTIATLDHATPTDPAELDGRTPFKVPAAAAQMRLLEHNARSFGIQVFGLDDARRGIVHVVGPELGLTRPGMTVVCGDSHTSTHGALGALAFGIGSTEIAHVLATQCILQRKPRSMAVNVNGVLPAGVTAKDLILEIIQRLGAGGGTGHVIEYRGTTIDSLSMEQRMTVCNMSIEAGARSGMIAPDGTTIAYLRERPQTARAAPLEQELERWRTLFTDADAPFDANLDLDASILEPMITYGTNPCMAMPIRSHIPPARDDPSFLNALTYMGFEPGQPLLGKPVSVVFIGSCTNGRLEDLEAAAQVLRGRKVAPGIRMLVVPGSQGVKRAAEAAGLADIFKAAGAEWREPGCSMCLGMNGDTVAAGEYSVSTSNRNFEGRQGSRARTLLASPITAAASAVAGQIADPRDFLPASNR